MLQDKKNNDRSIKSAGIDSSYCSEKFSWRTGIFRLALHNVEQNGCQANQWAFHNSRVFVFYCCSIFILCLVLLCCVHVPLETWVCSHWIGSESFPWHDVPCKPRLCMEKFFLKKSGCFRHKNEELLIFLWLVLSGVTIVFIWRWIYRTTFFTPVCKICTYSLE